MGTKEAKVKAIFAKHKKGRGVHARVRLTDQVVDSEPLAAVQFTGILDDEPVSATTEPLVQAAPEPTSEEERAERKRIKREKRAARRNKDTSQDDGHPGPANLSTVDANGEGEGEGQDVQDVQEKDEESRKRRKKDKKKARQATETATGRPGVENQEQDVKIQEGKDNQDAGMQNAREEHRPKKRRKVAFVEKEADLKEQDASGDDGDDEQMEDEQSHQLEQDPDEPTPGFLPTFPRPRKPRAPSAAVLYRQGLDKALAQAKIVESSATLPLKPPEVDEVDEGNVDEFGLSQRMRKRLGELEITELFAGNVLIISLEQRITDLMGLQTALLPFLLKEGNPTSLSNPLYRPYDPPRDVCVSAPTGSGKTLAYAVPIVEILSTKVVTRLRALIVLPTRELAAQVYDTLESVGRGRRLKMALVTGQHSFSHEQTQLVAETEQSLKGGSSKVDILVCTPGRLIDHLNGTPNFTLQHLRFLVIDEADRLIAQSFQDWLPQVLSALEPTSAAPSTPTPSTFPWNSLLAIPYPDAVAPAWHAISGTTRSRITTSLDEPKASSCQKLLFSATLTQDPEKIAALQLRKPKYFVVKSLSKENGEAADEAMGMEVEGTEQFALPQTLSEHWLSMESSVKPLALFYLVAFHQVTNALVFTKSTESTTRLVRLFDLFEKARHESRTGDAMDTDDSTPTRLVIRAFSSDLSASDRRSLLAQFTKGEVHILVCSDLMSRGIDMANVAHVVNYDVPLDMRRYVHRVGRTARAGRNGDAWTLAENQEVESLVVAGFVQFPVTKLEKICVRFVILKR
ncbi:ATP-dependent RNA helicase dbp6 [Tulasnella sp. 408]|nr:ATP-dependent RNA helicase dbp6 [Tulasnella sp. 408]